MNDTTTARPPRRWEAQTAGVVAAVAASALLLALDLAWDLLLWHRLTLHDRTPAPQWMVDFYRHLGLFALALLALNIGYLVGFRQWHKATGRVLLAIGGDTTSNHWAVITWRILLGITLAGPAITIFVQDQPLDTVMTVGVTSDGARVAGLLLLLAGIWRIRADVRERIAATGERLRYDRGDLRTASSMTPDAGAEWDLGSEATADETYWSAVAQLAITAGGDLPLLVATGPFANRWLLVPASGDVTAIRAGIPHGARVTLFLQPPAPGFAVPAGAAFHGFVDGRHQSVTAAILPAFVARAATAARWGLYPKDDPSALRATNGPARLIRT